MTLAFAEIKLSVLADSTELPFENAIVISHQMDNDTGCVLLTKPDSCSSKVSCNRAICGHVKLGQNERKIRKEVSDVYFSLKMFVRDRFS